MVQLGSHHCVSAPKSKLILFTITLWNMAKYYTLKTKKHKAKAMGGGSGQGGARARYKETESQHRPCGSALRSH